MSSILDIINTMVQLFTPTSQPKLHAILLATSLLCASVSRAAPTSPLVKTTSVLPWHQGIQGQLSCQVSVPHQYTIASESQAKLIYMLSNGSYVKKGDLLAEQDGFYLHQSLKAQHYELKKHTTNLDYHDQEYKRLIKLDKTHISESSINQHALSLTLAQQSVAAAKNTISTLEKQIAALKHYAPHDGEVSALHSHLGSFVAKGDAILSFIATNERELHCERPHAQGQLTHQTDNITFSLFSSTPLQLNRFTRSLNQRHQTQSLWFLIPNEFANLPIGKLVTVQWQSHTDKLAKLPVEAVTFEHNNAYVWRVSMDQKAEKVAVKVLQNQAHHFIVQSALRAGEHVIVLGQANVSEGTQVNVLPTDTLLAQGE
ncbi:efflux RND transporter periplasmic adaptor subunit [Pseudoalteromonas sp. SMS1]|uniref:efflux RND transporter periplasmic adaptor subunit n=1 Tax=Pseudoalteromonas sp. SMS1 TaxID=2908894 RepID=UPI001F2FBBC3|nr:efflux RND transporter periplasmic adaptor subunit [Pseudoalteromonas sp. SMS1]MCF2856743.1 efflux RND transporter periplasmic adaptor subunit [Pseudoalteromonas sp. SMS1]